MNRLLAALVLVTGALVLVPPTQAHANHDPCGGFVGPAELGIEGFVVEIPAEPAGTYYIDMRSVAENTEHLYSFWIYQEDNGVEGLQRGGTTCPGVCPDPIPSLWWSDPCQSFNPDRLIF